MYAGYALHMFHWEPSRFARLPIREKAMVIAMIQERRGEEKKRAEQARQKRKRR